MKLVSFKSILLTSFFPVMVFSTASYATFEGADIPQNVITLLCDSNPRIVAIFTDANKNIWYPANGPYANQFLSIALAAKTSAKPMYYYGAGAENSLTDYCTSSGRARAVFIFGIK